MSNKSNSSGIVYNGLAKISYLKGKRVVKTQYIKNHGTELLFKLLTQCVCGTNVSENMPKFLDIGYRDDRDNDRYKTNLAVRVNTTSKFVTSVYLDKAQQTYAACFTALIPPGIVLSDRRDEPATLLRLYNDYYGTDEMSLLAEITLPTDKSINFGNNSGYTLMIEWYMYFVNNSGEVLSASTDNNSLQSAYSNWVSQSGNESKSFSDFVNQINNWVNPNP